MLDRCLLPHCPGIGRESERGTGGATVPAAARISNFEARAWVLQDRGDLPSRDTSERDLGAPVPRCSGLARSDACVDIDKAACGRTLGKGSEEGRATVGLGWSDPDGEVEGCLRTGANRGVHQIRSPGLQAKPDAGQGIDNRDAERELGLGDTGHKQ